MCHTRGHNFIVGPLNSSSPELEILGFPRLVVLKSKPVQARTQIQFLYTDHDKHLHYNAIYWALIRLLEGDKNRRALRIATETAWNPFSNNPAVRHY